MVLQKLTLTALPGLPLVRPGDDLAGLILDALARAALAPQGGDVLVVTSKIVSKAEGRRVRLADVTPSPRALELAAVTQKDARVIEVILSESSEVVRARPGLIITRHRLGFVCANAGVDRSNVAVEGPEDEAVLLLPRDPDASAAALRARVRAATGADLGVILADSHGRPHRMGTIGVAVGLAGLPGLEDWRGRTDLFGYALQHTEVAVGDLLASAATLLLGQAAEGTPVVLVRGAPFARREGNAQELVRPPELDLFR
jgi:coenzyme F420-0:L-glutamate ligase/coenzyme F420-1:gamma-L-glutamate ligase